MTESLTFLVGIYFIYGTSLLSMKLNVTPARTHSLYELYGPLITFCVCVCCNRLRSSQAAQTA